MVFSVRDASAFHKLDRGVYEMFLRLGTAPRVARNIVALLMWLELVGVDLMTRLNQCKSRDLVLRYVAEAEAILGCLRSDSPPPPDRASLSIPHIASLVSEPLDLRFFYFHRETAVRGLTQVLDSVGFLIFDDDLYALLGAYEASVRKAAKKGAARPPLPPELAKPYGIQVRPEPEDSRSIFITFSMGYPLQREDVFEYFKEKWGDCVERVMMERAAPGMSPLYGRVVFSSKALVGLVLNGDTVVKFVVKGRPLWARKYATKYNYVRSKEAMGI